MCDDALLKEKQGFRSYHALSITDRRAMLIGYTVGICCSTLSICLEHELCALYDRAMPGFERA